MLQAAEMRGMAFLRGFCFGKHALSIDRSIWLSSYLAIAIYPSIELSIDLSIHPSLYLFWCMLIDKEDANVASHLSLQGLGLDLVDWS